MTQPVRDAIILAAGCGTRLRPRLDDRPKGLLPLGDTTPVDRALWLLGLFGVTRTVIVAGFEAAWYHACAARHPGVIVVENPDYATTGSMQSLQCALSVVAGDFLLLESDLVYEVRALSAICAAAPGSALLASGATGATDEVWVETDGSRLRGLNKNAGDLGSIAGEFVGITRVSRPLALAMSEALRRFVAQRRHANMAYETDALVEAAATCPVGVVVVPDLLWGEIDNEAHYVRVTTTVYPEILAREAKGAP